MAFGVVKWFNNAKGWGFIESDEGGEDIFVHYSQVKGDGFKVLRQGERVEFHLVDGPKGIYAENVKRVSGPEEESVGEIKSQPAIGEGTSAIQESVL